MNTDQIRNEINSKIKELNKEQLKIVESFIEKISS